MEINYLSGKDELVEAFLDEWYSNSDYITAHTSGSTGKPKEIHLPKHDMLVSARATCRYFGIDSHAHIVMPLSAGYIAGKMMIVRAIVSGAKLTVMRPTRDLSCLSDINEPICLLPIVPSQLESFLALPNAHLFRHVIVGGAPLTASQELAIAHSGLVIYATYGMTETCSHVALRRIASDDGFTAMPGISFGVDEDSCLIINAPEYSQRRFVTNDVVKLVDDRHFMWLGRRDNVINSGGIKIIPEEAERLLRPYFDNADFYLTARRSDVWGEEAVMIVATHGMEMDLSENIEAARAALPHHIVPKDIIQVAEHTYTSTGKLKRLTLND